MDNKPRLDLIEYCINQLLPSLGGVRPPVETSRLREAYDSKKYTKIFRIVMDTLNLDIPLRIGYVNKGGVDAPMWVAIPCNLPPYGSDKFKHTPITIYVRKSFLERVPFETLVLGAAHEMSHIVLSAIRHRLDSGPYKEVATDLTAMILGFSEIYMEGRSYKTSVCFGPPQDNSLIGNLCGIIDNFFPDKISRRCGYLNDAEAKFAAKMIRKMQS